MLFLYYGNTRYFQFNLSHIRFCQLRIPHVSLAQKIISLTYLSLLTYSPSFLQLHHVLLCRVVFPSLVPYVGMEFRSSDEAWSYWLSYGGQKGFEVRKRYTNKRRGEWQVVVVQKLQMIEFIGIMPRSLKVTRPTLASLSC